jgi:uncharacterized membrane protein
MNEEENEMWNDPKNWIGNFIYFNPKDKRILVLKRNPAFGMTLNFGRPISIFILAAFVIFIVWQLRNDS